VNIEVKAGEIVVRLDSLPNDESPDCIRREILSSYTIDRAEFDDLSIRLDKYAAAILRSHEITTGGAV
jgi:hypothetical protein